MTSGAAALDVLCTGNSCRSQMARGLDQARPGGALGGPRDLVVTVCDTAGEACPVFPRPVPRRHASFEDPATAQGTDDQKMAVFRRVRGEIRDRLLPEIKQD